MTQREQRRLFKLIVALLVALAGWLAAKNPQSTTELLGTSTTGTYRVTEFVDGDTIQVDMNGKPEKIRFIGVDTPETHDPRKAVQCFGQAAADFTKQLIGNSTVRLESDTLSSNRDRYDRLLRYVYLPNNRLVQAELIRSGYAFAYTNFPFTKSEEFKAYEQEARDNNRGLWGSCQLEINKNGSLQAAPAN